MKIKKIAAKIITALLVTSLLLGSSASCSQNANNNETDNNTTTTKNDSAQNANNNDNADANLENTTEAPVLEFTHEPKNFDGYTFRVLANHDSGNRVFIDDITVEEETANVLNDSYYRRNVIMNEEYGVKFKLIEGDVSALLGKAVKGGLDEYDAVTCQMHIAGTAAQKAYFYDAKKTILSLDMPWWDQNIVRDAAIGSNVYLLAGDIFIKSYDGASLMYFNKKIIENMRLENPYELVKSGKWTFDKFNQMVQTDGLTVDLDNNGKRDMTDKYGLLTQSDSITSFINGAGGRIVEKDANNMPYFTGASEKISNIFDKVLESYNGYSLCMHRDHTQDDGITGHASPFVQGRILFMWGMARYAGVALTEMEDPFGIIPMPKYDEAQQNYYASMNHYHAMTYQIPATAALGDIERTAYILDAMAYLGNKYIKPAYYEMTLKRKNARDAESEEMLDIIFSSTTYDIGRVYNVFCDTLDSMLEKGKNVLTSTYEKQQNKIEKTIDKLKEVFSSEE